MTMPSCLTPYENCVILSPSGEMLCRVDEKRIRWYLKRDLAEKISETPLTIRLKFEPAGSGALDEFLLSQRKNMCVVCGSGEKLTRHHILPRCYRVHFPESIKKHNSYDILVLCSSCHEKYECAARRLRRQILEELKISEPVTEICHRTMVAAKAATALVQHAEKIPPERVAYLRQIVADYCGKRSPSAADIKFVSEIDWNKHPEGPCASKQVVIAIGNINDFAKRWRHHFLKTMSPKCMPPEWDVSRDIYST